MNRNEYLEKIIRCRFTTDKVMRVEEIRIVAALEQAASDLDKLIISSNQGSLTQANYITKRTRITEILQQMSLGIGSTTRFSLLSTAQKISDIYQSATESFADSRGFHFDFGQAFSEVPMDAVKTVTGRVYSDGRNFSDRIWRISLFANDGVEKILTAGVSRGESAVNMSKELRQFLLNPELTDGTTWTTAIRKSVSGQGTIHYNALRLARTEINNAYREALVQSNDASPIMLGMKWNLSKTHSIPDICDVWADGDMFGIGKGVYPPSGVPIDHPNGRCFLTEVMRAQNQWMQPKQEYSMLDLSDSEILQPLAKAKEYQRTAALKTFNAVNDLLRQEQRRAAVAA